MKINKKQLLEFNFSSKYVKYKVKNFEIIKFISITYKIFIQVLFT